MNRRSLFGKLATIAAAVAVAPAVGTRVTEAKSVCLDCEYLLTHLPPMPEAFKTSYDLAAHNIALIHEMAMKHGVSHFIAAQMMMPSWYVVPSETEVTQIDLDAPDPVVYESWMMPVPEDGAWRTGITFATGTATTGSAMPRWPNDAPLAWSWRPMSPGQAYSVADGMRADPA